jgi:hypothetical protein
LEGAGAIPATFPAFGPLFVQTDNLAILYIA